MPHAFASQGVRRLMSHPGWRRITSNLLGVQQEHIRYSMIVNRFLGDIDNYR
jgi:hypothetical protein